MAVITYYTKLGCQTSAKQVEILRDAGHQVEIRDLLAPPTAVEPGAVVTDEQASVAASVLATHEHQTADIPAPDPDIDHVEEPKPAPAPKKTPAKRKPQAKKPAPRKKPA